MYHVMYIPGHQGAVSQFLLLASIYYPFFSFFFLSVIIEKTSAPLSGPEFIKLFSCSTQLSMKFFLLINVKLPTTVGVLPFISGKIAF